MAAGGGGGWGGGCCFTRSITVTRELHIALLYYDVAS